MTDFLEERCCELLGRAARAERETDRLLEFITSHELAHEAIAYLRARREAFQAQPIAASDLAVLVSPESKGRKKLGKARKIALVLCARDGFVTPDGMAEALGKSTICAYRELKYLVKKGALEVQLRGGKNVFVQACEYAEAAE